MTDVPDLAEPVAAWRMWDLARLEHGPELVSPLRPVRWPPRRAMVAACRERCAAPPGPGCGCGLYAMAELSRLHGVSAGHGRVLGCTALWGRVVEHTSGFRAEFGYPLVLFLLPDTGPGVRQLLRRRRLLSDVGDPVGDVPADQLADELAGLYRVPVRVVPDSPMSHGLSRERCAAAVSEEAVRGLAARVAGDRAAHVRLATVARDLFGDDDGLCVPVA